MSETLTELDQLVKKAAALHIVLEKARKTKDESQYIIDSTISDYVNAKNKISQLTDKMIYVAAGEIE